MYEAGTRKPDGSGFFEAQSEPGTYDLHTPHPPIFPLPSSLVCSLSPGKAVGLSTWQEQ